MCIRDSVWAGSLGLFLFICLRVHAPWLETLGLCAFGSLMVWTIAQACLDRILVRFLPPAFLPKLRQMPAHAHTVVVLPVVIEREEQIDAYFAALQRQYHAFRKAERMILLCDLPPTNTKDNSVFIPWLDHGVQTVARYNAQGEGRYTFCLLYTSFARPSPVRLPTRLAPFAFRCTWWKRSIN